MKKIKVFYHIYIPETIRASSWHMFLDLQMKELIDADLHRKGEIYITITMPKLWTSLDSLNFLKNGIIPYSISEEIITFEEKVREYITHRYPFAIILDVRDSSEENIYEGQCMKFIYKMSLVEDFYVCYTHSKGITNQSSISVSNWRELLNHFLIKKWKKCIELLDDADVVGLVDNAARKEVRCGHPIFPSGNFWWSTSDHIRKLPEPLNSKEYLKDYPETFPGEPLYRYAFERWVTVNLPKFAVVFNTNTEHYHNYCLLENLHKQKPYILDLKQSSIKDTNGVLIQKVY